MAKYHVTTSVNGDEVEFLCDPTQTLLDVLRDEMGLTGSKEGCGSGDCGACSVMLDGRLVCSCLVLGVEAEGRSVETIEGMAHGEQLHPLQEKFLDMAALQCGICTPGVLIAAKALLEKNPNPSETEVLAAESAAAKARWLLEQAATWPDLVQELGKDVREEFDYGRWHYINMPIYLTDEDESALEGELSHNMATGYEPPLRRNLNIIQALRGNLAVWHDSSASDADKAIALCWILHLTGDLHQPLHNVALFNDAYFRSGDRGGNDIEVIWGDSTRNLHAVWDGLPTTMASLEPSAATLTAIRIDTIDDETIDAWLRHHARLAEMFVYPDDVKQQLLAKQMNNKSPTITLSHEYLVRARSIARRQVNLAGHRIAELLD